MRKFSELLTQLKPSEYAVASSQALVYEKKEIGADKLISSPRVEDDVSVFSLPPAGSSKVANIYLDPSTDEVVVQI